jgi:DnaJ-domain-containing protein 1
MSEALKEEIVRAAYLTLLADERVAGAEREQLKDIAAALQISETLLDSILERAGPASAGDDPC